MRRNLNIIGPKQKASLASASGIVDTFDQYNYRLNNKWPKTKYVNSITPNSGAYNEGTQIIFSINTSGFENGDSIYYTIVGVGGSITTSDFTDGLISGSATITNNTASFTKTITLDGTSEVGDAFQVQIRKDSTSGTIIGTSGTFYINNPTFSITPSSSSFNEGSSVTWNISTTNINNGTYLYYSYNSTSDISSSSTGSIYISNNAGSFTTTALSDFTTEGNETLTAYLRQGSTSGIIVAQNSVTINDTSLTPYANITATSSVNEGGTITVNVNTNFSSGTLYWKLEMTNGNLVGSDFTDIEGTVSINSSTGTFYVYPLSDGFTEGIEYIQIKVYLESSYSTLLGTSSIITINDTSTGGTEPTGVDIYNDFWSIAEYENNDGASDTDSNYSVSEVQQNFTGTGQLYLIHKVTGSTSWQNDVPIACIQILDSSGSTIVDQYWFGASGDGKGWYTCISEYNLGAIGTGVNITPAQAASNYSYDTAVVNGTSANRFSLVTSTASSSTGAVDGIAEPTVPMTIGEKTVPQSSSTYYMYRETSGSSVAYCSLCRGPSRMWWSGERIRIAYIIGNVSTANYYTPTDALFVGIH